MEVDQVIVSATNETPVVQIVTWMCLVTSILAFFTQAAIKIITTRGVNLETILVFISLVLGVGQSATVLVQAGNGFGKPQGTLHPGALQAVFKSEYAATVLYFGSLAFSRLAITAFIHNLTPKKVDRSLNYLLGGLTAVWLLASVLVSMFQCPVPHPWDKTAAQCLNRVVWWDAVTSSNIVIDVLTVMLEIAIMIPLQLPLGRKISVIGLFTARLLVAIGLGVQLHLFHLDSSSAIKNDLTLGYWRSTITNQIVQCLAMVTTTLPYAKIFMESFESGMIRVDELRRRAEYSSQNTSGRAYKLLDISRVGKQEGILRTDEYRMETHPRDAVGSTAGSSR